MTYRITLVLAGGYHSWNSVTAAEAAKALARFIETDGAESWEDNE